MLRRGRGGVGLREGKGFAGFDVTMLRKRSCVRVDFGRNTLSLTKLGFSFLHFCTLRAGHDLLGGVLLVQHRCGLIGLLMTH